jgi:PAS domain S-box-containing protein
VGGADGARQALTAELAALRARVAALEAGEAERVARMAQLLDLAPGSIMVIGLDGQILYVNQRALDLHGYSREEFLALDLGRLDVPATRDLVPARMRELQERGEARFEVGHFRKDGSTLPLEVSARLGDWDGRKAVISVETDITERRLAEELLAQRSHELETLAATLARMNVELQESHDGLRRLESLRDNLIHMVVHDVRSPLTVVLGSLEVMQVEHASELSDAGRRLLAMGENSARRALDLLETVLDLSRLEAGQMPLARVPCELGSMAREAAGVLGTLQGGRSVSVEAPQQGVRVQADRELLARVLQNLLTNAFKATSAKDGRVRLVVSEEGGGVRVEVHDNGPGIPPEHRERVFDKFAQVDEPEARRPHSSGLGLTFCRLAVEAHGGCIGVKGSDLGGSAFWISLPADAAPALQASSTTR